VPVIASEITRIILVLAVQLVDVLVGVGNIDGDGVHGAVQEDGSRVSSLDGDVAAGAVITGDEHVVQGALIQLHADSVAVGVQIHVVAHIGQQRLVILLQGILVEVSLGSSLVLSAVHSQLVDYQSVIGAE